MKQEIKITPYWRKKAEAFADLREQNDSSFYRNKRGAFKREDILTGALCEIGAWKYLSEECGIPVSKPDFSVHTKKSYGADLTCGDWHYHVKGQTTISESKYGNSYLFQKGDKLVTVPEENHFIICCVVDLKENIVYIRKELDAPGIVWGEPRLDWLKKTKVALYVEEQL
jgi:hypothetical protein